MEERKYGGNTYPFGIRVNGKQNRWLIEQKQKRMVSFNVIIRECIDAAMAKEKIDAGNTMIAQEYIPGMPLHGIVKGVLKKVAEGKKVTEGE